MHNDHKEKSIFSKLQADVDGILDGIDHLFDENGDYGRETDPLHQIDIDEVLSTEVAEVRSFIAQKRAEKAIRQPSAAQAACFSPGAHDAFVQARDSFEYRKAKDRESGVAEAMRTVFRRLSY